MQDRQKQQRPLCPVPSLPSPSLLTRDLTGAVLGSPDSQSGVLPCLLASITIWLWAAAPPSPSLSMSDQTMSVSDAIHGPIP